MITVQLVADCSVAVLGGTAGVGLETASQFADQGARVVLLGSDVGAGVVVPGVDPGADVVIELAH